MLICLRVKIGLSGFDGVAAATAEALAAELLVPPCCPSIMCASTIGSGEEGADPGEGGPWPRNSRRFFSLFISSLRLLAICSGVNTDSLNSDGLDGELHSPASLLLGLQP